MNTQQTGLARLLAIGATLMLLAGCAGAPNLVVPDHYQTRIDSDGAKRFEFGIRQQTSQPTLRNIRDGQTQPAGNRLSREQIEQSIEAWMLKDGFCQQGFFIYDQRYDGSMYLVLGECREAAAQRG